MPSSKGLNIISGWSEHNSCEIHPTFEEMPRIETEIKLDFKDVLVRPKRSTLRSRSDVSCIVLINK